MENNTFPPTIITTQNINNNNTSEIKMGPNHQLQQQQQQPQQQYNHQQQQHTINEGEFLSTSFNGRQTTHSNNNSNNNNNNNNHHQHNNKFTKNVKSTDSLNSQKNLDDWLENCLRDPPNFISSEFNEINQQNFVSTLQQQQQQGTPNMFRNSPGTMMRNTNPIINVNSYSSPTFKPNPMPGPSNYYNYLNPNILEKNLNMLQISMTQDFASLPPGVNMMNQNTNNNNDNNEQNGFQDLLNVEYNQSRRFSDPGIAGNSDNESQKDDIIEQQQQQQNNIDNKSDNSKLLSTLLEQINLLHETNSKICRNLHETKVEIEALKHTPSWGLRHRRDSISGLSTHSQPLGYFGTQSPAPTYHSGNYTPGMLTDVVREVREAARIREEALLNRVKALVDERSWNLNENNFKLMRELEELKIQIQQIKIDKKETNLKMNKLEEELKLLKTFLSHTLTNSRHNFLNSLPNRSTSSSSTIDNKYHRIKRNYGPFTINDENTYNLQTLNNDIDNNEILNINNCENLNHQQQPQQQQQQQHQQNYQRSPITINRNERYNDTIEEKFLNSNSLHNKSFGTDGQLVQLEKDTLELRRELQDALAGRNQAANRIKALEQMVHSLQNGNKNSMSSSTTTTTTATADNQFINNNHHHHHQNNNSNNTNLNNVTSVLKIIEPNTTNTTAATKHIISQAEPQVATQIQNVAPSTRKLSQNNSNICLTGPVTDL